jgi:threonine synthase
LQGPQDEVTPLRYVSTRGAAPVLGFEDVLLAGLASDGGLYVPANWPSLSTAELGDLRGRPYSEVALAVMRPFIGGAVPEGELVRMIREAYAGFRHAAVTPLRQLDANHWLLELFHGPTLAFKDVAMQFLARLMDWALERRGGRATIVVATSGDTGGAAVEAFRWSRRVDLFVLHPQGRVSEVQRRQMTTVAARHVYNIAIAGTFDDCQGLVKAMFADAPFRDRLRLTAVNSINWARILAQTVYYVAAGLALGAPGRSVSFSVPTGNFGDIFAGYAAKRMGLPIERLIIATNINDILARALNTGRYEVEEVAPTASPSMDIQVSSNFERQLFEALGRDSGALLPLMQGLGQSGAFSIPEPALHWLRATFDARRIDEAETISTIASAASDSAVILDPHTAVGYAAARRSAVRETPMITLATAHPAKFPEAVERATGTRSLLPSGLADLYGRREEFEALPNRLADVEAFIGRRCSVEA